MKRVPIAEFKANCSRYVEEACQEDIVITKHGKDVARLVAEVSRKTPWEYVGVLKGRVYVDPDDDLLSTNERWDANS